jgi:hypothetical protein
LVNIELSISLLADFVPGCEEGLEVAHDLLVADIGGEKGRVDTLGEIGALS